MAVTVDDSDKFSWLAFGVSSERPTHSEFPTIPEACRRSGIGRSPLARAIKDQAIPVFQIGGWKRVRWSDVVRWIEAQRVPVTDHAARRVAEVLEREGSL